MPADAEDLNSASQEASQGREQESRKPLTEDQTRHTIISMKTHLTRSVLLFACGLGALTTEAALVGPSPVNGGSLDGAYQISFLDLAPGDAIPISGKLDAWNLYAMATGTVKLQVFQPVAGGYQLVGENSETITQTGVLNLSVPSADQISVQPGDILGFRYNGTGIISFSWGGGGWNFTSAWPDGGLYDVAVGGTIPASALYSPSQDRTYSLQADITPVPEPATAVVGAGALLLVFSTILGRSCK